VHAARGKDRYGRIAKTNITDGHRAASEALVSGVYSNLVLFPYFVNGKGPG
jgi:hypothetical protein